jgi:hypothetical protein
MPAKSKAQQRLMQAAEHGADFPMAQKLRDSMSHQQLHDFSVGSEAGKPEHVAHHSPPAAYPNQPIQSGMFTRPDLTGLNTRTLKNSGMNERDATIAAIKTAGGFSNPTTPVKVYRNQHKNLGKFLHPRKDGKSHGSDFGNK